MGSFFNALEFLTIISIPKRKTQEIAEIGKSSAYFPLVGFLLGLILVGANLVLSKLLTKEIVSAFIIFLLVLLTRAIHLDGLADTMDGLWGGKNREEKLKIMKDSRIGAFGVIALFFALLFKFLFLNSIPNQIENIALILMLTLSRWSLTFAAFFCKSVREEGLGHIFVKYTNCKQFIFATLTVLIVAFVGLKFLLIVFVPSFVLFNGLFIFFISWQLGGITGDVLGALAELSEIVCLAIIYILA